MSTDDKPLGTKAYGSIPHLPGSRLGEGDHHCHEGQAVICLTKTRDRHDVVYVQEKLDGSCVAVARIGDDIVPLIRAGYRARDSRREFHHVFADWAEQRRAKFLALLADGERCVGEWLGLAHGTRYKLSDLLDPFVGFDLMAGGLRAPTEDVIRRLRAVDLQFPMTRTGPMTVEAARAEFGPHGGHGAIDPIEGFVWRVERKGRVDFLAKYVEPAKRDGAYLPEVSGGLAVWNWSLA